MYIIYSSGALRGASPDSDAEEINPLFLRDRIDGATPGERVEEATATVTSPFGL